MAKTLFGDVAESTKTTGTTLFGDAIETNTAVIDEPQKQPLDPQEAYDRAGKVWDFSIDQEIPISDVEDNIIEFKAWDNNELFDPAEPPQAKITQDFEYKPDLHFDKETIKRNNELHKQKIAVLQDYFGVDPETNQFREVKKESKVDLRPPTIADPDEPPRGSNVPTLQDIVVSLETEDIKYIIDTTIGTKALPKELNDVLGHEYKVRVMMENLKSYSEAKQAALISGLTFTNLFNLPEWTSRKGINPIEIFTGEKHAQSIAMEAAARVLAEKNKISAVNVARIANAGANILKIATEFWLVGGIGKVLTTPSEAALAAGETTTRAGRLLAKIPASVRPYVTTGIKFATQDALTAPRQGETFLQKGLSITESFFLGFGVGVSGKFIKSPLRRVVATVGGFIALTYAKTGDIEAAIETGFTVLGFEAVGLMQQAMQFSRAKIRNIYADKAVQVARKHNPELRKFTNKEITDILQKQARNFAGQTGRDLSQTNTKTEFESAWIQKQQGDPSAWNKLVSQKEPNQAEKDNPLTQPTTIPTEKPPEPVTSPSAAETTPEGTKVPPAPEKGVQGQVHEVYHGGPSSARELNPAYADHTDLRGTYFTADKEHAQLFAKEHGHGEGIVRKYKVTLKNPANDKIIDAKEAEAIKLGYKEPHLWDWVTEELKAEGYDGAIREGGTTEVIAFNKKSILPAAETTPEGTKVPLTVEKDVTEGDLIQEAKKYKTAEEFVKAQGTPVFHGTSLENANKINAEGFKAGAGKGVSGQASGDFVYATGNKVSANKYVSDRLGIKNPTVVEGGFNGKVLKIQGKMADFEAFGEASKKLGVPLEIGSQGKPTMLNMPAIKKAMQEQGYGAISFSDRYANGSKAFAILPENIKTKAQLTDIWNKAQAQPPAVAQAVTEGTKVPPAPETGVQGTQFKTRPEAIEAFRDLDTQQKEQILQHFYEEEINAGLTSTPKLLRNYNEFKSGLSSAELKDFESVLGVIDHRIAKDLALPAAKEGGAQIPATEKLITSKKPPISETPVIKPPKPKEPGVEEIPPNQPSKIEPGLEKVYQDTINRFASLENIVTRARKLGATIPKGEDTGRLARSYLGIGGKATSMLEKETFVINKEGNPETTGEGLKPIITSVDSKLKKAGYKNFENDFEDYLISTRIIEDLQRKAIGSEELIATPKQTADARAKLAELKEKYGDDLQIIENHAKRLYDYQKRILNLLVDSGNMSQESYDTILEKNQHYIPFDRVLPEDIFMGGTPISKKRFTGAKAGIRKIKGSEKPIENVFESIIKNTYKILDTAERNKVARSVYNLKAILPDSIQKISPKFFPIKVSDELTTFRPSPLKPTGTVIEVYENGKRKFMKVTPNIYDAMTGLNEPGIGLLTKIFSIPAHTLRVGATITPEFITRNPIRDQWTAFMQTNTGFVPIVDTLGAMSDLWKKSDVYYEWLKVGGTYSGFIEFTRPQLEKTYKELIGKKSLLKRLNIIHTAQDISQFFEQATRLGIFKAAKRKGLPSLEAGFAAREGTLDFMRRGAKTKDVNAVIAFFNAGVQAADKMVRVAANDPIGFAMKGFVSITLPSLLLYLRNRKDEDYKEIPRWRRDLFWNIHLGNNWISIPKPFAYGQLFGSLPERFFEYLDTKDKDAFDGIAKSLAESMSPVAGDPASGLMPTALKPLVENTANWNFFLDRPIVPQGKERLLPEAQYTKFTSRTARELGEMFDYPPAKIENIVRGYLGGTGRYILDAGDVLINQIKDDTKGLEPKPLKTIADIPLIRGFVGRGIIAGQSESLNKFYETYKNVMAATQTTKAYLKRNDIEKAKKTLVEHKPDIETEKIFSGAQQYITKLNDGIDKILSSDIHTNKQKTLAIEELERIKIYIAKKTLLFYKYKEKNKMTKEEYQKATNKITKIELKHATNILDELQ